MALPALQWEWEGGCQNISGGGGGGSDGDGPRKASTIV